MLGQLQGLRCAELFTTSSSTDGTALQDKGRYYTCGRWRTVCAQDSTCATLQQQDYVFEGPLQPPLFRHVRHDMGTPRKTLSFAPAQVMSRSPLPPPLFQRARRAQGGVPTRRGPRCA